jgi:hypothetical protein
MHVKQASSAMRGELIALSVRVTACAGKSMCWAKATLREQRAILHTQRRMDALQTAGGARV